MYAISANIPLGYQTIIARRGLFAEREREREREREFCVNSAIQINKRQYPLLEMYSNKGCCFFIISNLLTH